MAIYQGRFVISRSDDDDFWAEPAPEGIAIQHGKSTRPEEGRTLLTIRADQVQRLDAWAHPEGLLVPFTGVLARQIKDQARDLGLTPENFVVEALNAFIQAGEMAAAGHEHTLQGPPAVQEIQLETPPPKPEGE